MKSNLSHRENKHETAHDQKFNLSSRSTNTTKHNELYLPTEEIIDFHTTQRTKRTKINSHLVKKRTIGLSKLSTKTRYKQKKSQR